jgi:hypothetical protein
MEQQYLYANGEDGDSDEFSQSQDDFDLLYHDYARQKSEPVPNQQEFNSEFEDVTQLSSHFGFGEVFKTSDKQSRDRDGRKRPWESRFSNVSLLLRRIRTYESGSNREIWIRKLEIQSATLRLAFKEIAKGFTAVSLEQNPIVIPEPFAEIYVCRDRIRNAIEQASSDELKKELKLLETFRESYMAKTIMSIETSLKEGMIEAEDLWSLFPIGSRIIVQNRAMPETSLMWCPWVKRCHKIHDPNDKSPAVWRVDVEYMGFNGKQFSRAERTFHIGGFYGSREIHSLPAYPFNLHPEQGKLRESLVRRGKRYVELCIGQTQNAASGHGSHCNYTGPFWEIPDGSQVNFFNRPSRQVRKDATSWLYLSLHRYSM